MPCAAHAGRSGVAATTMRATPRVAHTAPTARPAAVMKPASEGIDWSGDVRDALGVTPPPASGRGLVTTVSPCGVASCPHPRHSHSIACEGAPRGSACCCRGIRRGSAARGGGPPPHRFAARRERGGSPVRAPFLQGSQRTETHLGGSVLFLTCSFSLRLVSMLPCPNRKA